MVQFENFSKMVTLEPGDFPPVLDIEEMGKYGTENLVAEILNWLKLAEKHYVVIPIVYTGSHFYRIYLMPIRFGSPHIPKHTKFMMSTGNSTSSAIK